MQETLTFLGALPSRGIPIAITTYELQPAPGHRSAPCPNEGQVVQGGTLFHKKCFPQSNKPKPWRRNDCLRKTRFVVIISPGTSR
jgi:hypothetical protein